MCCVCPRTLNCLAGVDELHQNENIFDIHKVLLWQGWTTAGNDTAGRTKHSVRVELFVGGRRLMRTCFKLFRKTVNAWRTLTI